MHIWPAAFIINQNCPEACSAQGVCAEVCAVYMYIYIYICGFKMGYALRYAPNIFAARDAQSPASLLLIGCIVLWNIFCEPPVPPVHRF